jgi:hypothetical protein
MGLLTNEREEKENENDDNQQGDETHGCSYE